jgi:hypothetical protein
MHAKALTTFALALALSLPTAMFTSMSSAQAGPGDTIRSATKDGKRTHKRANAKRSNSRSNSDSNRRRSTNRRETRSTNNRREVRRSNNRREVRRTTTTRRSPRRTVNRTTRTRTVRSQPRTTTRRTTVRHNRARTVRSTRTRHVHHSRTRNVHHHRSSRAAATTTSRGTAARSNNESSIEAYITGGLGYSGFDASAITDEALPGVGYNIALGVKGEYIGFEFGFNGSGHTFDPEAGSTDLAVLGLSGDLKLQPSFGFFEPYAFAGLGGYSLQDGVINEASAGAAIRLGLGADFRFDDAALGVRYLHSQFGFTDDSGIYGGDFGASSETLGINLSFYF